MHQACIKPSVPGVKTSLVITFKQIWLTPVPAAWKTTGVAPWEELCAKEATWREEQPQWTGLLRMTFGSSQCWPDTIKMIQLSTYWFLCMWGARICLACPGLWQGSEDFYQWFQERAGRSAFENPTFSLLFNANIKKMYFLCQLEFCKGWWMILRSDVGLYKDFGLFSFFLHNYSLRAVHTGEQWINFSFKVHTELNKNQLSTRWHWQGWILFFFWPIFEH